MFTHISPQTTFFLVQLPGLRIGILGVALCCNFFILICHKENTNYMTELMVKFVALIVIIPLLIICISGFFLSGSVAEIHLGTSQHLISLGGHDNIAGGVYKDLLL